MALYGEGNDFYSFVIHDGINGVALNKIFSKGIFYGHGANSSDLSGADTIKLIPDIPIYDNESSQFIIIEPTSGNHIHIRAGGNINNSDAILYLGGEVSNFRVDSGVNPNVYVSSNSHQWAFNSNSTLTFPDNSIQSTAWAGGRVVTVPTTSAGASGDKLADIAFNNSYFYYCTADYTNGLSNIWKRIGWSGDTW
jgi:hypothetical protein